MLSVYSFKQRVIPVVTMIIFATLAVAMTVQSANAQDKVMTLEQAQGQLRHRAFLIDTIGCQGGPSQDILDGIEVSSDGTFRGRYYQHKSPSLPPFNVSGSINIGTGTPREGGITFTVSFTVNSVIVDGVGVDSATFNGAIRFRRASRFEEYFAFMAGTYTFKTKVTRPIRGPFPFSAQSN